MVSDDSIRDSTRASAHDSASESAHDPVPTGNSPRKHRRWLRLLLGCLAVVVVLIALGLFFLPDILSSGALRGRLTERVRQELELSGESTVEIGSLTLSWTGAQDVGEIRVQEPRTAASSPGLSVRQVRVSNGLWDLLFGDGPIEVSIDTPVIRLRRDRKGRIHFPGVDSDGDEEDSPKKPPSSSTEPEEPEDEPWRTPVSARDLGLHLKAAEIHYVDETLDTVLDVTQLALTLDSEGARAGLQARAELSLRGPDGPTSGKLDAELNATGLGKSLAELVVSGHLKTTGAMTIRGVKLEDISSRLETRKGKIHILDTRGGVNGGEFTLSESVVDLTEERFRIEGQLQGVQADYNLVPVLAYAIPFLSFDGDSAEFSGVIDASLQIEGKGFSGAQIREHLVGNGALRIHDGSFSGSRFFAQIYHLTGQNPGEQAIAEMGSDFSIADGKISTENLFFQAPESKVRQLGLRGYTTFDQQIEYSVDLSILQETIGDKKIKRILGGIQKALGNEFFPLQLSGSIAEPRLILFPRSAQSTSEESSSVGVTESGPKAVDPEKVKGILDLIEEEREERKKKREERKKRRQEKKRKKAQGESQGESEPEGGESSG